MRVQVYPIKSDGFIFWQSEIVFLNFRSNSGAFDEADRGFCYPPISPFTSRLENVEPKYFVSYYSYHNSIICTTEMVDEQKILYDQ